jgi:hypothetical protein
LTRSDGVTIIEANPPGPADLERDDLRVDDSRGELLAILILFIVLQRQFIRGVVLSGMKGG